MSLHEPCTCLSTAERENQYTQTALSREERISSESPDRRQKKKLQEWWQLEDDESEMLWNGHFLAASEDEN